MMNLYKWFVEKFRKHKQKEENMSEEKTVKARISDKDFVVACVNCNSYQEVADRLGMTALSVQARASKLRKLGVALAKYDRAKPAPKVVDVQALNALIG
jgi:transposase